MNNTKIQQHISEPRFNKYLIRCDGDYDKSLKLYQANTKISQLLYTILNHYEVALRNGVHYAMTRRHDSTEWYDIWIIENEYEKFQRKILNTKHMILRRREDVSAGKIIAEFTLGFWSQMFNADQERLLWGDLRLMFRNIPRRDRQRTVIGPYIQKVRKFRNRIYHYEPICWSFSALRNNYLRILKVIEWIDNDLYEWVVSQCEFQTILQSIEDELIDQGIPTN